MLLKALTSSKPVIHVGPPKTGTTSLQSSIIPYLGRPFQIKPNWARSIARDDVVQPPRDLPPDVIVSHEGLGDFSAFPPPVIAGRLHTYLPRARIIFVARDPVESFFSLYRQRILNHVTWLGDGRLKAKLSEIGMVLKPLSADKFFERELEHYLENGRGFFAMIRTHAVHNAFAALFEIHTIPFDLLRTDARHFVEAFSEICDFAHRLPISHENRTDLKEWTTALARVPNDVPPAIIERLQDHYLHARLKPGREDFIRRWPETTNLEALADAFRVT